MRVVAMPFVDARKALGVLAQVDFESTT